ncbi:MAG: hypothetical protein Q9P90_14870 [candidate division KSB1 bacterium]|nr:hypothetical protein [candidate division KSB1 bacterium]
MPVRSIRFPGHQRNVNQRQQHGDGGQSDSDFIRLSHLQRHDVSNGRLEGKGAGLSLVWDALYPFSLKSHDRTTAGFSYLSSKSSFRFDEKDPGSRKAALFFSCAIPVEYQKSACEYCILEGGPVPWKSNKQILHEHRPC